jgi:replicative DNA helicase
VSEELNGWHHEVERNLVEIHRDRADQWKRLAQLQAQEPKGVAPPESIQDGAEFILDRDSDVDAIWGTARACLWAKGEPFYLCGPSGLGKTTIGQQLLLRRMGLVDDSLFDMPVEVCPARVLYIAADRPRQAARSFSRMVSERDREALRAALVVWPGALPGFSLSAQPERFLPWVREFGEIDTVFIDSLFNVAPDMASNEGGPRTNEAFQSLVREGIEVMVLHHNKKLEGERTKPRQDDMYGHSSLRNGAGSIAFLTGEPGTATMQLHHVKSPVGQVSPLDLRINFKYGLVEIDNGLPPKPPQGDMVGAMPQNAAKRDPDIPW